MFNFKSVYRIKAPVLTFSDEEEYDNFKILLRNEELCNLLIKAGIYGIRLESRDTRDNVFFEKESKENDILFELSINNKYHEIMDRIEKEPSNSVKAYYYSLVKYTDGLSSIMNDLKELYASFDYQKLSNQKCYELAIYEFNNTCMGDMEKDIRTHHIHVVKWNGTEWKNYIRFRDYLNANGDVALQYQKLKEELESKYAGDRAVYTNGKQDMINKILNELETDIGKRWRKQFGVPRHPYRKSRKPKLPVFHIANIA